jgi:uncharacterized protein YdeI (YjbR/CyaY-like superfamily)
VPPKYFASPALFRAWLAEHHADKDELVVGFYKRGSDRISMTWPESVVEALCFGWIDGVRHNVDARRYTIRFTPRRKGSIWSAKNIATAEELVANGKMMPAGAAAFAARDEKRSRVYSFERAQAAELSAADAARFEANARAWTYFQEQPAWYRRTTYHWVISAKRDETREKRLATLIADSAAKRWIKGLQRPAKK